MNFLIGCCEKQPIRKFSKLAPYLPQESTSGSLSRSSVTFYLIFWLTANQKIHTFPLRSVSSLIPFLTPFTHNPLIRSDEGLALETSAIVSFTAFHYPHQHTVDTPVCQLTSQSVIQSFIHSVSQSVSQLFSQSVIQSVSQSVSQSVIQSVSYSVSQLTSQSVIHSVIHSFIHSFSQSVIQSVIQSVSQSVSQPVSYSVSQLTSQSVIQSFIHSVS